MTHDWLSLMSRIDVGTSFAGLITLPRNRLKRLLIWVGMSKLLEGFLATMASSHAEDRRLAKDGGEVRI